MSTRDTWEIQHEADGSASVLRGRQHHLDSVELHAAQRYVIKNARPDDQIVEVEADGYRVRQKRRRRR